MTQKQQAEQNILDSEALKQIITELPRSNSWGGSTDIVATELSQDLVIPAYTDAELTVKKVEKGVTGIDFGTVTFASTTSDPIIPHSLKKTPTAFCIVPKGEMGEGSFNEITNFLFYSVKPIKSSYGLYGIWVTHYKNELNNEAVYETFSHAPTLSSTKISLKGKFLNSYYWFAIA